MLSTPDTLLLPDQVPPTPPMPTMSITPKGVLHLHASLREHFGLRYGQPIDLISPYGNQRYWYLDLRACAVRQILWGDDQRMRVTGIVLPPGLVTAKLTLHLLPGAPKYPDYYPLWPDNALSPQARTPPLAA